jgi:hypothetical protein
MGGDPFLKHLLNVGSEKIPTDMPLVIDACV